VDITHHDVPTCPWKINTAAINAALGAAKDGDTVLVPAKCTYYMLGGIGGANLDGITLQVDGTLVVSIRMDPPTRE